MKKEAVAGMFERIMRWGLLVSLVCVPGSVLYLESRPRTVHIIDSAPRPARQAFTSAAFPAITFPNGTPVPVREISKEKSLTQSGAEREDLVARVSAERRELSDGRGTAEQEDPSSAKAVIAPIGSIDHLPVAGQLGEWVNRGPKNYGGKVHDLDVDPTDEDIVFAAYGCYSDSHSTNGTGAGLWRTQNGGKIWQPVIPAEQDPCVLSVDVHTQQTNFVVAGLRGSPLNLHQGSVQLSRDGGDTWASIGPPSADPTLSVVAVKFDITDPNTVYAATHKGLFKTSNGGQDWTKVLDYSGTSFWDDAPSLAMHPTDPDTLMLCARSLGVQLSHDGGNSWSRVDINGMLQNNRETVVAWSTSDPDIVYAERVPGLPPPAPADHSHMLTYRSTDGGQSWSPTADIIKGHQGHYDMSIAVDPSDENHVIVANTNMVYSTDGLLSVHSIQRSVHADQLKTVFAPSNPSVVYNGNDGGVWKSTDGGLTWGRSDWGVRANHTFDFSVYPNTGIINLSAGDYGAIAYDPQDPQENGWHNSDCGFEYKPIFANPSDPNDAYYFDSQLIRIGDANHDCQQQSIDPERNLPAAQREPTAQRVPVAFGGPANPTTIYLGKHHLWKHNNLGAGSPDSWIRIGISDLIPANHYVMALQVAQSDAQTIYVITGRTNQNGELWATHDGGESWTDVHSFQIPRALAVSPDDPSSLYVGTDMGNDSLHGLFRSRDGGVTFEQLTTLPANLPVNKIIIDPEQTSRAFVATGRGVILAEHLDAERSADVTFSRLGSEMPDGIVASESLVNGASGRTLFAASDQGLWSMELNGLKACQQRVTVLPNRVTLGSSGGRVRLDISIALSCQWDVEADATWARLEAYGQGRGPAVIDLMVEENPGNTRETTLDVAGQLVQLKQFGGVDPIAPDAVVTIRSGEECLASGPVLEPCEPNNADQIFRLQAARPLLYRVVTASNQCLDTHKSRVAGLELSQNSCMSETESHQLFEFVQDETGWRLRENTSGRTPGPEGYTLMCQENNGTHHLAQQLCSASNAQRFQIANAQ